jgi:polyferredoxin
MRYIRIVLLITLITHILITKTAIYEHYDPFKAIYNLIVPNTISWVLVILVLVSSVFIYRPFCKMACPIGLILGWVSKIPGASVNGNNETCTSCTNCNSVCKIRAITRDQKISRLDNQECIACGDCLNSCKKYSMDFYKKGSKHHDKIECKG